MGMINITCIVICCQKVRHQLAFAGFVNTTDPCRHYDAAANTGLLCLAFLCSKESNVTNVMTYKQGHQRVHMYKIPNVPWSVLVSLIPAPQGGECVDTVLSKDKLHSHVLWVHTSMYNQRFLSPKHDNLQRRHTTLCSCILDSVVTLTCVYVLTCGK